MGRRFEIFSMFITQLDLCRQCVDGGSGHNVNLMLNIWPSADC